MAVWAVQRAGNWNTLSGEAGSPWNDAGAQAALNTIPAAGDTITNAGAFQLTFDIDLPDVANVLSSDTVNRVAGTYHAPDAAEVISTAVFGPASAIAGTFNEASRNTDPGVQFVKNGVTYKICNVSKTGADVTA